VVGERELLPLRGHATSQKRKEPITGIGRARPSCAQIRLIQSPTHPPGFDSLRQRHCDRDIGLTGLERSVPVHLGKRANSTHMSTLGGIMGRISARLTTVVT